MCNCINEVGEKIKNETPHKFPKPIRSVSAPQMFTMDGNTHFVLPFSVELEGVKKEYEIKVIMLYCPFCGEKKQEQP